MERHHLDPQPERSLAMTRVTNGPPALSEIRSWPKHMSFSQLSTLHPHYQYSCARRGAYKYVTHLEEERNWSLALGTIVDAGWNIYWSQRIVGNPTKDAIEDGHKALDAELKHEVDSYPELTAKDPVIEDPFEAEITKKYRGIGHSCLELLFTRMAAHQAASVQEHHTFDLSLGDVTVPVNGYSDMVGVTGDVWDLKISGSTRWTLMDDPNWENPRPDWHPGMKEVNPATGRQRKVPEPKPDQIEVWDETYLAEKSDQLMSYWLARNDVQERRGRPIDPPLTGRLHLVVVYANATLVTPQLHETEITVDLDRAHEVLVRYGQAVRIVQARRFPLRPGRHCAWCSFLERCRDDQAHRGMPFMDSIDIPFDLRGAG